MTRHLYFSQQLDFAEYQKHSVSLLCYRCIFSIQNFHFGFYLTLMIAFFP